LEILALLFAFEVMWNCVVLSNRGCLSQALISNAYSKKISNHGKFCPNSFVTIQPNYHRGLRSC